jgi:hypothetical protein
MVVAVAAGDIRDDIVGFGFVIVVPNEYPACVVDQFAAVVTLKARTSVSVRSSMKDKRHSFVTPI